MAGSFLSTIVN